MPISSLTNPQVSATSGGMIRPQGQPDFVVNGADTRPVIFNNWMQSPEGRQWSQWAAQNPDASGQPIQDAFDAFVQNNPGVIEQTHQQMLAYKDPNAGDGLFKTIAGLGGGLPLAFAGGLAASALTGAGAAAGASGGAGAAGAGEGMLAPGIMGLDAGVGGTALGSVNGLGAAAAGGAGAVAGLGGVGGSGLTEAEMAALSSQAAGDVATGVAGPGGAITGTAATGAAAGSALTGIDAVTGALKALPGGSGTAASAGSALSRLLGGNAGAGDYASILGNLGAGALDAYGANKQADTLQHISDQYMGLGAPSRDRYNASFAPGFTMANDPGYTDALNQASKATLHGLSVQGNPSDSPNAWAQSLSDLNSKFAYPALQDYRASNANTGGFGAFNAAAPGAAQTAAGAQSNIYGVAGKTLANITNPTPDYSNLLKLLGGSGGNIFGSS